MPPLDRLSNAPLDDAPRLTEDAQLLLDEIDTMLGDGRYNFAASTLKGIAESVERTGTVSVNQHRAVENIRSSKNGSVRAEGAKWRRRYEGQR